MALIYSSRGHQIKSNLDKVRSNELLPSEWGVASLSRLQHLLSLQQLGLLAHILRVHQLASHAPACRRHRGIEQYQVSWDDQWGLDTSVTAFVIFEPLEF